MEDVFTINSSASSLDITNVINAKLKQAEAIIGLITENGSDINAGFTLDHESVCNALWAVENYISDIIALRHFERDKVSQ